VIICEYCLAEFHGRTFCPGCGVSILETRTIADESLLMITMRGVKDRYAQCEELFCFAYDIMGKLPDIWCPHFQQINGKKTCDNCGTTNKEVSR